MGRSCASVQNFFRKIDQYPAQRSNLAALEALANTARLRGAGLRATFPRRIPVVVHVIHTGGADDIPDEQVVSQIEVLNEDFNNKNSDLQAVPDPFKEFVGNSGLEFYLADVDPGGAQTNGITRTRTTVSAFGVDDSMKSDASGGKSPWDTSRYLNLWVCQLSGGVLGYAQFPGGDPTTDGVVVATTAFGRGDTFNLQTPFNLGRTATHEVGHYLNLFHIWGNSILPNCTDSDSANDTPNQFGPNTGKPSFPSPSCGNTTHGDMFMNYMDYVDDDTMVMFTKEQVARMHAALEFSRSGLGVAAAAAVG
jgi:Pregnancy-associated plasma protein-A